MDQGEFLDGPRRERRCALPGYSDRRWLPATNAGYYMGALPIVDGPMASEEPVETHHDGCPGAWQRCRFVQSVEAYERHMSEDGVFSQNHKLDRSDDPLVHEAVQLLEQERARARIFQASKAQ